MFKKIAAIAFVAAFAPVAFAGAESGDAEIAVSGDIISGDGFTSSTIFGAYGYYFTDAIKVDFILGLSSVEAGGFTQDTTIYGINGEYNFGGEDMVPFVFAGFVSFDSDGFSDTGYSVGVGARFYMSENAGFKIDASMNTVGDADYTASKFGLFYNF